MADKNLEEAKKLNQWSMQGNTKSSKFDSNYGAQEAQQLNSKSAVPGQSGATNTTGTSSDAQQARQLNSQSASGTTNVAGTNNYGAQQARQLNSQSVPGRGSFSNLVGNSAIEQARKANKQSGKNKK